MDNSPAKKLTDNEVRIASFIEQRFWINGAIPTDEVIQEQLSVTPQMMKKAWANQAFRQSLIVRGIDLGADTTKGVLTPEQTMFANMLLNVHDRKSVREKLKILKEQFGYDVTSQQYHAWLRQPAFSDYLRKRAEELFKSSDFEAYTGLIQAIQSGDMGAIKLHFEMRGIYNPKVQVDVNVEAVVVKLIEIVSKYVTDPGILQSIASEIEMLGVGDTKPAIQASIPIAADLVSPNQYSEI